MTINEKNKSLDLISLGRASVDLYGNQVGSRLEDMSSFAKYIGGCATNIAYGTAKLGLKSALLTRVGDEHMGRFIREELQRGGVDVSHVKTDTERLTALVILGIKTNEEFPLIFYRSDCADMAISESDFDEDFIASSRALVITGTHLSTDSTFAVSKKAVDYAKANHTKVILDIDYRPVLWGLTGIGEGENRFVESAEVTQHLQTMLPECDLIVGTEEEFNIAGGTTDIIQSLKAVRAQTSATLVLKLGALGCTVLEDTIPERVEDFQAFKGVRVDVLNVLGAGDAFMSGFLRGWLRDEPYERCCAFANACGALTVSRHGCAPAIPSEEELQDYLSRSENVPRPDKDSKLNYLHAVSGRNPVDWHNLCILAFDHRKQFFDMATDVDADPARISPLKGLLAQSMLEVSADCPDVQTGFLADDTYGQDVLNEMTGTGLWIGRPVELPSSRPLEFEGGVSIGQKLASWPREHVVKCLVFYHPQDPHDMRLRQERQIQELYKACVDLGLELLLEIIPPVESETNDDTLPSSIQRFYNLGVYPDWWKLPPPSAASWDKITRVVNDNAPHCRGVLLLGLDVPQEKLIEDFKVASKFDLCKGFAIGRTIFAEPSRQWLANKCDDSEFKAQIKHNYLTLIDAWQKNKKA